MSLPTRPRWTRYYRDSSKAARLEGCDAAEAGPISFHVPTLTNNALRASEARALRERKGRGAFGVPKGLLHVQWMLMMMILDA